MKLDHGAPTVTTREKHTDERGVADRGLEFQGDGSGRGGGKAARGWDSAENLVRTSVEIDRWASRDGDVDEYCGVAFRDPGCGVIEVKRQGSGDTMGPEVCGTSEDRLSEDGRWSGNRREAVLAAWQVEADEVVLAGDVAPKTHAGRYPDVGGVDVPCVAFGRSEYGKPAAGEKA